MLDTETYNPADVGLCAKRLDFIADYFESSYIDSGRLPCMGTLVARHGKIVHEAYRGNTEFGDAGRPVRPDTIFRIYSMTKPITSVAAMMLFEQSAFRLDQPISRFIPEFADTMVWDGGTIDNPKLKQPDRPIQIVDLFRHTSGLTYAFLMQTPVDAIYRRDKIADPGRTLEEFAKEIASKPLVFSPGTRWNYSNSIDVLGRLIEVLSGQSLDVFLRERIFEPLGMNDTGFYVPEDKIDRLMACYSRDLISREITEADGAGAASTAYAKQPSMLNAGGGLVSTMHDYYRFANMLRCGGTVDGTRILSRKTLDFMTKNHLPEGRTIGEMGDKTFSESRMEGNGFGLGWSVLTRPVESMQPGSVGTFAWGGMASTYFWVDPVEDLVAIQLTQLMPSGAYPIRPQFQQLVYAAIND